MQKISKIILVLLLLGNISSLQTWLNEDKEQPIEIQNGSKVEYDKERSYFMFNYEGPNDAKIFFRFDEYNEELYLTNPKKERNQLNFFGDRI